jgi:hypothetical protein
LSDALTLSEKELEVKKYKDYQGLEAQWDLRTVFEKYFVPEKPVSLGDNFYHDIKSEGFQAKIKKILEILK